MRNISIIFLLFTTLFLTQVIFSQGIIFDTHSLSLNGELSREDPFEDNFGRFDAYELSLHEGDFIKLKLKAEFFPLLTVVSPSGDYKLAFPSGGDPEVKYELEINETGHWYIYVSGDSTDTGAHDIKLFYVSANTRQLEANTDICTVSHFMLAHANTNYFYLRNNEIELKEKTYDIDLTNQNLFQSNEIKVNNNNLNAKLQTISLKKEKFNEWTYILSECLPNEWTEKTDNGNIVFEEINGSAKVKLIYSDGKAILNITTLLK